MIANVRSAEAKVGRRIPVLMDIGGPKVRTDNVTVPSGQDRLHVGDELLLTNDEMTGRDCFSTGCTLPQVLARLDVGHPISIDDGKLAATFCAAQRMG